MMSRVETRLPELPIDPLETYGNRPMEFSIP
jgi:hypothetical protein